jgi:lipopolysaccharide export system permease protein
MGKAGRTPLVWFYMLRLLGRPLLATLLVVLPALLLERLLRLFDLVASGGGAVAPVIQLVLYLTPHYVGLALPAAFFISLYTVVSSLSEHHELDALQSSGISLLRLAWPFMLVGVVLSMLGLALFGYLQPLGRYDYRAALNAVMHAGWNATVSPGEFTRIGSRMTVSVDAVDRTTGQLTGIFIQQRERDGTEVTTTARTGWLTRHADAGQVALELDGGTRLSVSPEGEARTMRFDDSDTNRPFSVVIAAFRPRGDDEREMTLGELWRAIPLAPVGGLSVGRSKGRQAPSATATATATVPAPGPAPVAGQIVAPDSQSPAPLAGDQAMPAPGGDRVSPLPESNRTLALPEASSAPAPVPRRRLQGELHSRLVRSFSLVLLPLLAMPMGLGAKRTRRWHGIVLSALILVIYHHGVQLAESLGDIGVLDPRPALWGLFTAFAIFCVVTFRHAHRHPYEGPFDGVLSWLDWLGRAIGGRLARLWPWRRRPKQPAPDQAGRPV